MPAGTWSMTYDSAERQTGDTGPLGTLAYGLDNRGDRISLTYPDGAVIKSPYDARGHFTGATLVQGSTNTTLWADGFDTLDRVATRFSAFNGFTWGNTWQYSVSGTDDIGLDLTNLEAGAVTIDLSGTPTSPNGWYLDFDYAMSYDQAHKLGSLTSTPVSGLPTAIAHPKAANSLTGLSANTVNEIQTSGSTLTYIHAADLSGDGSRSYTYDNYGLGRLLSATAGSTGASYTYDAFGRRIAKTVNGVTTQYLVDDSGAEVGEYDGSGNLLRRLVYDPLESAPVTSIDAGSGTITYNAFDRLGSGVATGVPVGSSQFAISVFDYLPYGDTVNGTVSGTEFGYAGYRFDAETGTYHAANRTYDPRLGRFLQTDPIGQDGGLNIYEYAGSDPINGADPNGLDDLDDDDGLSNTPTYSSKMVAHAPSYSSTSQASGLSPAQGAFGGAGSTSHGNPDNTAPASGMLATGSGSVGRGGFGNGDGSGAGAEAALVEEGEAERCHPFRYSHPSIRLLP